MKSKRAYVWTRIEGDRFSRDRGDLVEGSKGRGGVFHSAQRRTEERWTASARPEVGRKGLRRATASAARAVRRRVTGHAESPSVVDTRLVRRRMLSAHRDVMLHRWRHGEVVRRAAEARVGVVEARRGTLTEVSGVEGRHATHRVVTAGVALYLLLDTLAVRRLCFLRQRNPVDDCANARCGSQASSDAGCQ